MHLTRIFYITIVCLYITLSCGTSKEIHNNDATEVWTAFYNLENLFDTLDHPTKEDEYFTPDGPTKWDSDKYWSKMSRIKKVYDAMERPALFGVSEIENENVLIDLKNSLNNKLEFTHFESPDNRGIDVALLYSMEHFDLITSNFIRISFPDSVELDYTSRDILYTHLKTKHNQSLHVFVNHWPSRRGGLTKSSPKREHVANVLTDSIRSMMLTGSILMMGDFNDEPNNKSIADNLQKGLTNQGITTSNLMTDIMEAGQGSYNYRGDWNVLDQFIVSFNLIDKDLENMEIKDAEIFKREFMIYNDKKYGEKPNRTYGGPNYYGGFSDHYPIRARLIY